MHGRVSQCAWSSPRLHAEVGWCWVAAARARNALGVQLRVCTCSGGPELEGSYMQGWAHLPGLRGCLPERDCEHCMHVLWEYLLGMALLSHWRAAILHMYDQSIGSLGWSVDEWP